MQDRAFMGCRREFGEGSVPTSREASSNPTSWGTINQVQSRLTIKKTGQEPRPSFLAPSLSRGSFLICSAAQKRSDIECVILAGSLLFASPGAESQF